MVYITGTPNGSVQLTCWHFYLTSRLQRYKKPAGHRRGEEEEQQAIAALWTWCSCLPTPAAVKSAPLAQGESQNRTGAAERATGELCNPHIQECLQRELRFAEEMSYEGTIWAVSQQVTCS
ncbi:uncharacterized protein LOC143828634 [Paroedura picta]|uniref:uncharacterized protein LOC143828634 n=1 Tax=Paroedura picta TaxID=143630 RepID=UPI004055E3EA